MFELVELINEVSYQENGKISTYTVGYKLRNIATGVIENFSKIDACMLILQHGAVNVEVKTRIPKTETELANAYIDGLLYYLKTTDGKKLSYYLSNDIKSIVNK